MLRYWLAFSLSSLLVSPLLAQAPQRPNFIIMMTDDQRADSMSCAGNTILKTPNLDRIAAGGMRFKNMFVTNALCAPSRATLLTGLYSHSHGIRDNSERKPGQSVPASIPILSDRLRAAGYEVAFVGKSHIPGFLRDRQWDYYFGFKGQGNYLKPVIAEGTTGADKPYDGYMDDVTTGKALEWLKSRDSQKPFCLFLFFKAPHRSWDRAPRHKDLYQGVTIPEPATFRDGSREFPHKPHAFADATNKVGAFPDVKTLDFVKDYYATLVAVDENVGKVLDLLQERKLIEDTAVFYTSDNGFFHGEWGAFDKRLMHEPSIKVPLLVSYPRLIKPASTADQMVLNVDIAPTVLDLAQIKIPSELHGRSLVPLLKGEPVEWRKDWLYEYYEYPGSHMVKKNRGIRTDRWKLIHYFEAPEEFELYDLQNDPGELHNLADKPEHAATRKQLEERMLELRKETRDPDVE